MSQPMVRWGILGTASIARKNWLSIQNSGNGVVAGVASRETGRAQTFIDECQATVPYEQAPKAYTYHDLLDSKEIDAVYIPLPTGIRRDWVIRAANKGKHVLVEKPVGVSLADVDSMLEACRRNGVQFMDGVMFMHSRRLDVLRSLLNDVEGFGQLRRISVQFSFAGGDEFKRSNIRVDRSLEPAGCLGDLGWYCIRAILWARHYELPVAVTGQMILEHQEVPTEFSGELRFQDGTTASFFCSFEAENQQWLHFSGTRGSLRLRDFVLPFYGAESEIELTRPKFTVAGCHFNMEERCERIPVHEYSNSFPNSQEANLFRNFSKLVIDGTIDPTWGEVSRKTQLVMDTCLKSALKSGQPQSIDSK